MPCEKYKKHEVVNTFQEAVEDIEEVIIKKMVI